MLKVHTPSYAPSFFDMMKLTKPSFYDSFRCLASACPDSCCQEWTVVVDPESAAQYRTLPSSLGDRLRQVLTEEDGDTVMSIENSRCPMWRQDGLCQIQAELGHDALCKTCREFPRLTHDYGTFVEAQLELSCPEAARLILRDGDPSPIVTQVPGGDAPDYDGEAMQILLMTRENALALIGDPAHSVPEMLALLLFCGYHAQSLLDGLDVPPFDPEAALVQARTMALSAPGTDLPAFFQDLEILTQRWRDRLGAPSPAEFSPMYRRFAAYTVGRYWLQAVADYDLAGRAKMAVIACLLVQQLGGDPMQTAQLYAKEIENNADNIDALLDGCYESPLLADDRLLKLLL